MNTRRKFLKHTLASGSVLAAGLPACTSIPAAGDLAPDTPVTDERLEAILRQPVLRREFFPDPVMIERVELLRFDDSFICRVRSADGAEGLSVSNNMRMEYLYPIQALRVQPFFIGKDARDLDSLIEGVYVHQSNYKFQSYALWIPVATVEFAILDLLGRIARKPIGQLIGEIHNPTFAVYAAPEFREKSAEESIALSKELMERLGTRALKIRIGERMGQNSEPVPGRTDKLIPLARKVLGDDVWLAADVNGGFTVEKALWIGRELQDYGYAFYEEPVPFDWYEETKLCADALTIRLAGGEQESGLRSSRWIIANNALQVLRHDMFYFGGMIRTMKVARMADAAGMSFVPHLSGSGLGYVYQMHFISAIPNAGPYQPDTRSNAPYPVESSTSTLQVENGMLTVPTGPGLGVQIDPDYIKKHKVVTA